MATEQETAPAALRDRLPADPTLLAVVAFALLGLVARLADLGTRVMHWDEARVGFGILRYAETGAWEYRPIVHGPFLPHVNEVVFGVLGPSDFSARLVVALVGSALPLSAWLFRERLRDSEVVALAGLLALNPLLLYYSRFMRNDLLLGAFMLFSLGFLVRTFDTRNPWYLYAASGFFALGFTTKENALLYALCWLGAAALLFDHRLLWATSRRLGRQVRSLGTPGSGPAGIGEATTADGGERSGEGHGERPDAGQDERTDGGAPTGTMRWDVFVRSYAAERRDAARLWFPVVLLAVVEFLVIIVLFYAPRGAAGPGGVGLFEAVGQPTMLPAVVEEALLGSWEKLSLWTNGSHQDHAYLPYLEHYLLVMRKTAGVLSAFAVVGFLADRYAGEGPRDLVSLCGYWGFVSVLGYPLVTDLQAGWTVVHALVPLAVPAAVGLAMVGRWGHGAYADGDQVGTVLAVVLLLGVAGLAAGTAYDASFQRPADPENVLVQYGQPEQSMAGTLEELDAAVGAHGGSGPDVLFYGDHFYVENESAAFRLPVGNTGADGEREDNGNWYHRLPLAWYYEKADADVDSVRYEDELADAVATNPPVVVTRKCSERWDPAAERCVGSDNAEAVGEALGDGYVVREHELTAPGTRTVFFVRADLLDDAGD